MICEGGGPEQHNDGAGKIGNFVKVKDELIKSAPLISVNVAETLLSSSNPITCFQTEKKKKTLSLIISVPSQLRHKPQTKKE